MFIVLKSMPANIKQLSLKFDIEFQEFDLNVTGILHFKQTNLNAKITHFRFKKSDMKEMTMIITMHTIAKYQ